MTTSGIVVDLIQAFRRSKTMFAAVTLGVFDTTPGTAEELAAKLHCRELERLLDACVGLGLLQRDGALYRNTSEADRFLRADSPDTLRGYILYSNEALYPMWGHLEDAVREGSHRWTQTFGAEGPIFAHFFRTDEAMREFLRGMHGFGQISSPAVAEAFDLSRFHRLVDLGGASGHLAHAAHERWPHLDVAVFELPTVARFYPDIIPGDFFTDPLPQADLYALGQILHDWPDAKATALLKKIHDALPEGGGLLIAEKVLDDDRSGPMNALMQHVNMLVCTEGCERAAAEYEALLRAAGFRSVEVRRTPTRLDAILAMR